MVETSNDAAEARRPGWWSRRPTWQKWAIGVFAGISLLAIIVSLFRQGEDEEVIPFSQVITSARNGEVERIDVRGQSLRIYLRGQDETVRSRIGSELELARELRDESIDIGGADGVELKYVNPSPFGNWLGLFLYCLPPIIFGVVIYFVVRNAVREGIRQGRREL